jgi:hypothetical protein
VSDSGRFDGLNLSKPRLRLAEVVEWPGANAEEDRDHRDHDLVDQPGREVLLDDVRAAAEREILVARCSSATKPSSDIVMFTFNLLIRPL